MYRFEIDNTRDFAIVNYYQRARHYHVDVPEEQVPHHIRVWLVNHKDALTGIEMDEATPEKLIDFLDKKIEKEKLEDAAWLARLLACPDGDLIMRRGWGAAGTRFEKYERFENRHVPWTTEKVLAEKTKRIDAEVATLNADQLKKEAEIEEAKREAREHREARAAQQLKEREEAVERLIPDIDQERFNAGLMPEREQRDLLRDAKLPLDGILGELTPYTKIKAADVCNCDSCGETSYYCEEAGTMSRDEFDLVKRIQAALPGCEVIVQRRWGVCNVCDSMLGYRALRVETSVGDWKLNRIFEISDPVYEWDDE